ncbi:small acid-soluble spore protein (thioredoxin-like protein) [Psychrobacillus sp. OK028]|uniref:small acid-soluble spore protein Tlp n=1 Tax=Psychrobacillus sp. OK028 TaxID=1884359 RepID=UPI00088C0B74|nr:small acid-soluble spore protein Tlp [Psychrobacillus sp. OK028]SDN58834.1 small acid-soluble spore protein (thioredoxin-like protein) [Psychrobacillus sp. OK028]
MSQNNRPNPDDRSDNVKKLKKMVSNTKENMEAAEEAMEHTSGNNREAIREKNKHRKESIEGFRREILDEAEARKK